MNVAPPQHTCFKNWNGSSSGMEADIITEGFCKSIEMHGLRYKRFIADGDSSVFAKIKENVPYGRYVEKLECTNHVLKNYGKALYKIKKDTTIPAAGRKLLTQNKIKDLEKDAQKIIYKNAGKEVLTLKTQLAENISNVFKDETDKLKKFGIFHHMQCK